MFKKIWEWFCLAMGVSAYEDQSERAARFRSVQERARQERGIEDDRKAHEDESGGASAEAPSGEASKSD